MTSATPETGALDRLIADPARLAALARARLAGAGPEPTFDRIARLAAAITGAPVALVSLVEQERQFFAGCVGFDRRETPLSHSVCKLALVTDGPLVFDDIRDDPRVEGIRAAELGVVAYLGVPLRDGDGHTLGSLCVIDGEPRTWTDADVERLQDLAELVMTEIVLRRTAETLEEERRELSQARHDAERGVALELSLRTRADQLLNLARSIAAADDLDDIVGRASLYAGEIVGAMFTNLAVREPGTNVIELRHGSGIGQDVSERWPRVPLDRNTPHGMAISMGVPVLLCTPEEIASQFPIGADDAARAGFKAVAAYPIRTGRSAIGFAWDTPVDDPRALHSAMAAVAELVGLGIDRAVKAERDRHIADQLQQALLPVLPPLHHLDLAARYVAGERGMRVGGDWYAAVERRDGTVMLGIGDLVGHGLAAATAMGQMRSAFEHAARSTGDVAGVMAQLEALTALHPDTEFSSAVVIGVSADGASMSYASAGHPAVLLRRRDGSVERLGATRALLGLGSAGEVRRGIPIQPGDTILLYTDGLLDHTPHEDADAALVDAVRGWDGGSALVDRCNVVYAAMGSPNGDDVALLLVDVIPAV